MSGLPGQPSRKSEIKSLKWEQRWCHSREKEHATSTDWQSSPKTCRSFFREISSAYVEIFDSEVPDLSDRLLKNSHGRKGEKCPRKSKKQIQRVWWATAAITTAQRLLSVCKITWNEKWRNTSEVIYCDVANICRNRLLRHDVCFFLSSRGKRGYWDRPGESGENPAADGGSQGGESENGRCYRKSRHLSTRNTWILFTWLGIRRGFVCKIPGLHEDI